MSGDPKRIVFKIRRFLKNIEMLPSMAKVIYSVYIRRKPIVRQAGIAITYACTCKCRFCSAQNIGRNPGRILATEEIEDLIDQFASLGCLSICFSGGEPLLHKDIIRLVKRVRKKKMLCSIITSCVNYSDALWEDLKRAGVSTLYFSVDGIGEKHDAFRNVPDLFSNIEKAIQKSRALDLEFYFNGVVTNENIATGNIYEIVDYCKRNNIELLILQTSASGKFADPKHLLTSENLREFERIRSMKGVLWEGDTTLVKEGCPAGIQVVFISGYGDVMPCPFIEISFGNIREMSLEDAVKKMWSYDIFGNITPICLMGADRRFYNDWLMPLDVNNLPVRIEEHPMRNCKKWARPGDIL